MILEYFGEQFAEEDCQKSCANCALRAHLKPKPELKDFTALAISVVEGLTDMTSSLTLIQLIEALKGRGARRFQDLPFFKQGKAVSEQVLRQVVLLLRAAGHTTPVRRRLCQLRHW